MRGHDWFVAHGYDNVAWFEAALLGGQALVEIANEYPSRYTEVFTQLRIQLFELHAQNYVSPDQNWSRNDRRGRDGINASVWKRETKWPRRVLPAVEQQS